MHLEDCPHKMNAVCPPAFRKQHPDLRRRRIDFYCYSYARMLPQISAKSQKIRGGHTFIVMGKKVSNYIAGIIPIGPRKALYTLDYSTTTPTVIDKNGYQFCFAI